ncbi:MAG: hypothetical protein IJ661_11130 [Lachnospiraceae bacterium]|nr:hypothetical protein [Lachnospiraceae bacterium]
MKKIGTGYEDYREFIDEDMYMTPDDRQGAHVMGNDGKKKRTEADTSCLCSFLLFYYIYIFATMQSLNTTENTYCR